MLSTEPPDPAMFGKRWRVDRSARSTGGVDVFRTCAIPPTGAFGFGFGQQRVRPIHRCAQQSEPVSPTRRSSRPCTLPITLRPNRSTCRGCVTRRSSDSTVLPARTVATRPAPTFTCCPPRGANVDGTESPRNARRSRWHGSRRFPSRSSVDRTTEYPHDCRPDRRSLTSPGRQHGGGNASPAAARSEQASRALPGRSLVAPLNRAAGVACGAVRASRFDRHRRLSPRRLERCARPPGTWQATRCTCRALSHPILRRWS